MAQPENETRLDETALTALLAAGAWQRDGNAITRTFAFKGFKGAIAFVNRVAEAANAANHHPDIHVERYRLVRIVLTTHATVGSPTRTSSSPGGSSSSTHPPREVAVFVHRGERLLVLHRVQEDYWHVVAGALEEGETFATAAARELREETGLEARPTDLELEQTYAITEHERPLYPPGTAAVVIGNFHVEAPADWEPRLNEEHDRHTWATLDVASELMQWVETQEAIAALAEVISPRP
jgi:4a-hydroxytetrahydrobiopterin dehydratase